MQGGSRSSGYIARLIKENNNFDIKKMRKTEKISQWIKDRYGNNIEEENNIIEEEPNNVYDDVNIRSIKESGKQRTKRISKRQEEQELINEEFDATPLDALKSKLVIYLRHNKGIMHFNVNPFKLSYDHIEALLNKYKISKKQLLDFKPPKPKTVQKDYQKLFTEADLKVMYYKLKQIILKLRKDKINIHHTKLNKQIILDTLRDYNLPLKILFDYHVDMSKFKY